MPNSYEWKNVFRIDIIHKRLVYNLTDRMDTAWVEESCSRLVFGSLLKRATFHTYTIADLGSKPALVPDVPERIGLLRRRIFR